MTRAITPMAARPASGTRAARKIALLGGTTSAGDCVAALGFLANPRRLIQGNAVGEYEEAFARQVGVRFAVSFSAGRVGLYGLLRSLGVGAGDEVLVQVPTHVVVANAIRYTGAWPVYVDCDLKTYNIDLSQAERQITARTKVLVLQHTFGIPVNLGAALELARRHNLKVIEDCVHALGAAYDGRPVGGFGKAAFFSTEETKTISTTMGGLVVTDDEHLAERMYGFQEHCSWPPRGLTTRYLAKLIAYHFLTEPHLHRATRWVYEAVGEHHPLPRPTSQEELQGLRPPHYERRLSNAQASVGLRQLGRLDANLAHRAAVAEAYRVRLRDLGFRLPEPPSQAEPAYVRYPVWVEDRAEAVRRLARHIVPGTWFTSVLEEAVSPALLGYVAGSCPRAEAAARHLVNLPTHGRVRVSDIDAMTTVLAALAARH